MSPNNAFERTVNYRGPHPGRQPAVGWLCMQQVSWRAAALLLGAILAVSASAADTPLAGSRYKITKPIFVMGVYEDLNDRQITKELARAYLDPIKLALRAYTAFHEEVPAGTMITILARIPKRWYAPWAADQYLVRLIPDLARGLDCVLSLNRGLDGDLDGLNSAIFERIEGNR